MSHTHRRRICLAAVVDKNHPIQDFSVHFYSVKEKKSSSKPLQCIFPWKKTMKYPFAVHGKSSPISSLTHLWFGRKIEGQNSVSSIRVCTSASSVSQWKKRCTTLTECPGHHFTDNIELKVMKKCVITFSRKHKVEFMFCPFSFFLYVWKKSFLGIFKAIFSEIDSTSSVLKHSIYSRIQYAGKPHPYHAYYWTYYGKIQIVLYSFTSQWILKTNVPFFAF